MDAFNGSDFDPFVTYDGDSYNSGLNKEQILVSSVFLSVVMVLVLSRYLYTRCVLMTGQSRRHSLSVDLHHTELLPPPTTGLDPALVAALPVFLVEPKAPEAVGGVTTECAVCLSDLQDEEMAKLLPNCKHSFHVACIDTWLASHSTCPLCRARVQRCLEPHLREGPTSLPLDVAAAPLLEPSQGTSGDGGDAELSKIDGSDSQLSSFRRVLSRERSRGMFQPSRYDGVHQDLERQ